MTPSPPTFKRKQRRRLVRPEEMSLSEMFYLLLKIVAGTVITLTMAFFVFHLRSGHLMVVLNFAVMTVVIYWHSRARSVATFLGVSKLTRISWGQAVFFLTLGFSSANWASIDSMEFLYLPTHGG